MTARRKPWAILLASVLVCGSVWMWMVFHQWAPETAAIAGQSFQPQIDSPLERTRQNTNDEITGGKEEPSARVVEERHKAKDRENLRQLHKGLFDYRKIHGHFPEYLSQLAPDFVSADALESPRHLTMGMNVNLADHPDPGKERPAYGYEFSNVVFRDERTFADIKETQRAEWGDVVPILRAFGYGKVINMSYGGDLYETDLNWEWDTATLDVVKARGWGPGLSEGEFTQVRVLDADGQPVANAQVWADGRKYSFDLPHRYFTTDATGIARIPLGADLSRTALVLRVEGKGLASSTVAFPLGQQPQTYDLTAEPSQIVGGRVTDANGAPIPNTWIYLKAPANEGASLGAIKTDASGQWTASLHPKDAAAFNIVVSSPENYGKFSAGEPVDAADAAGRQAVSIFQPQPSPAGK